jgi:hypothetical protein
MEVQKLIPGYQKLMRFRTETDAFHLKGIKNWIESVQKLMRFSLFLGVSRINNCTPSIYAIGIGFISASFSEGNHEI